MSYFDDVGQFNGKFGLPHVLDGAPQLLDDDVRDFRVAFLLEEVTEYIEACKEQNLEKAADALVDLVYVALGTAHMMRVPFDECWREVQRANMAKERARDAGDERSSRKHALDVVKPAGWKPPNLAAILDEYAAAIARERSMTALPELKL